MERGDGALEFFGGARGPGVGGGKRYPHSLLQYTPRYLPTKQKALPVLARNKRTILEINP